MDQSETILHDIELWEAHTSEAEAHTREASKIAARIKRSLRPVSTGGSKNKSALSEQDKTKILTHKRKSQFKKRA